MSPCESCDGLAMGAFRRWLVPRGRVEARDFRAAARGARRARGTAGGLR